MPRRIIDLSFVKYMKATLFTKEPAKGSFWLVRHHSHNLKTKQGIEMKGFSSVGPGSLASPLGVRRTLTGGKVTTPVPRSAGHRARTPVEYKRPI